MSRHPLAFLRPRDTFTSSWGETNSKMSTIDPMSTSLGHPPSLSPSNNRDSLFPAPHPYTLGGMHYSLETPIQGDGTTNPQEGESDISNSEKMLESTTGPYHPRILLPITRVHSETTRHLRPIILLLLFLPIPPFLSLIYIVTGHAILRTTQSSPESIFHAPLLSSIEAAATGGVILSLPLTLLLCLLYFPAKVPAAPEDFFDDDTSSILGKERWLRYVGYTLCALLVLSVGGIAGPLGVTCLSSDILDTSIGTKKMLNTGAAAAAGILGGVLLVCGCFLACAVGLFAWTFWLRRHQPQNFIMT